MLFLYLRCNCHRHQLSFLSRRISVNSNDETCSREFDTFSLHVFPHFFFFPLIALFPFSLSFYFPLSSVSLRYNSLSFASYFPLHHFSRYSPFHSFSFSIFIRAYPIPTTPLRVPLFLSLDFLSLTCTIHSMCLAHSQTMQFSRLRAIFAE